MTLNDNEKKMLLKLINDWREMASGFDDFAHTEKTPQDLSDFADSLEKRLGE